MSTTEFLELISLISYILSGVCLLLAIFFWVKFSIPDVINYLSGRTGKKSIENVKATNEKTEKKAFASNTDSKKLIDDVKKKDSNISPEEEEKTEFLQKNVDTAPLEKTYWEETGVLYETDETVSFEEDNETMPLDQNRNGFVMLDEVILVHTKDIIT